MTINNEQINETYLECLYVPGLCMLVISAFSAFSALERKGR